MAVGETLNEEDGYAEDFGQRVDLTQRIREILASYPEGTTILKELVQNADDAGASTVRICLDRRQHGTERLAFPALRDFQGPALLVYNDAVFSEEDFESISSVGSSTSKRNRPEKTGRFGIGFNSTYHLTDVPCFCSGRHLVYFDPHCRFLPNSSATNPGKRIDYVKHNVLLQYPDQFRPLCAFGCDMQSYFAGTLFRFPLRTEHQARSSRLSTSTCTSDMMASMLSTFASEAETALLFLKAVVKVELFEWLPEQSNPRRVSSTHLQCDPGEPGLNTLTRHRQLFAESVKHWVVQGKDRLGGGSEGPVNDVDCYRMGFIVAKYTDFWPPEQRGQALSNYAIAQGMGSGDISELARRANRENGMAVVPWGAVAAPLAWPGDTSVVQPSRGQAFCFLPLPIDPGVPVHVNGYFELSSNRRDIWHGVDMEGSGAVRAEWNQTLLRGVLAPLYARLVEFVSPMLQSHALPLLWPQETPPKPWQVLVHGFYQEIACRPILFSRSTACSWLCPQDPQTTFVIEDEGKDDATVFPCHSHNVVSCLEEHGFPLVSLPRNVFAILKQHSVPGVRLLSAGIVRDWLRGRPPSSLESLQRDERRLIQILEYCLSDLDEGEDIEESLDGVPLVPLCDGSVATFRRRGMTRSYYIVPENEDLVSLLSPLSPLIVRHDLPQPLHSQLASLASQASLNVELFTAESLASLLYMLLPEAWAGKSVVPFHTGDPALKEDFDCALPEEGALSEPSMEWMMMLWRYLGSLASLQLFADQWPLLLVEGGRVVPIPRGRDASNIVNHDEWLLPVVSSLRALNCFVVHSTLRENSIAPKLGQHVQQPTLGGVLEALKVGNRAHNPGGTDHSLAKAVREHVSSDQRQLLRRLMLQERWFLHDLPGLREEHITVLRSLPIFERFAADDAIHEYCSAHDRLGNDGLATPSVEFVSLSREEYLGAIPSMTDSWCLPPQALYSEAAQLLRCSKEAPLNHDSSSELSLLLRSSTQEEQRILCQKLSVTLLGKPQFYECYVMDRLMTMPATLRDQLMIQLLRELPGMCFDSARTSDARVVAMQLKERLRSTPFVPTGEHAPEFDTRPSQDGTNVQTKCKLASPQDLYDPRVPELVALLDPEVHFPSGAYCGEDMLSLLQPLGLKNIVTTDVVLESARHVAKLGSSDPDMARQRGHALLTFLAIDALKWLGVPKRSKGRAFGFRAITSTLFGGASEEQRAEQHTRDLFWQQMTHIAWVPVHTSSPCEGLPWPTPDSIKDPLCPLARAKWNDEGYSGLGSRIVMSPASIRPLADMWFVSASMGLIDGDCASDALAARLGWRSAISLEVLLYQLFEIGMLHRTVTPGSDLARTLSSIIPQLYTLSANHLERDCETPEEESDRQALLAAAKTRPCVWVGDGFSVPTMVSFSGSNDLSPYLHVLPGDMAPCSGLLRTFGVREAFTATEYLHFLSALYAEHGRGVHLLGERQVSASIFALRRLAEHVSCGSEDERQEVMASVIYAPDDTRLLVPITDLVYNDTPWLPMSKGTDQKWMNSGIPAIVAQALGIRSRRLMLLSEDSELMGLDVREGVAAAAEAFGQHEALTTRLKHIVRQYAEGPAILYELIQNADDAGATEVSFCLDERTFGTKSIFSPRMAAWQGPSVLSWNNAQFSPRDFHNIARIGQESKTCKAAATGRFGLGFNSVYHFTDVPSFVSGEYLVLLDPHASHLPGASAAAPGLKIRHTRTGLAQQFADQFSPYDMEALGIGGKGGGTCIGRAVKGTLFRFPLRDEEKTSLSEIRAEQLTPDGVLSIFKMFACGSPQLPLFLKKVRKISLYHVGPAPTTERVSPNLLYCVETSHAAASAHPSVFSVLYGDPQVHHEVTSSGQAEQNGDSLLEVLRALQRTTGCSLVSTRRIELRVLSGYDESGARRQTPAEEESSWLVAYRLGGETATKMALENAAYGFVPMGAVAMQVPVSHVASPSRLSLKGKRINGKAWCTLPLPLLTGLPVHVNGTFELSSNRRDLWHGKDMSGGGSIRSDWNEVLVMDVIAPAYVSLLQALPEIAEGSTSMFEQFQMLQENFPASVADMHGIWTALVKCVYKLLAVSSRPCLFCAGQDGQWVPPSQAVLTLATGSDPNMFDSDQERSVDSQQRLALQSNAQDQLLQDGVLIVQAVPWVVSGFRTCLPPANFLSPRMVRNWFRMGPSDAHLQRMASLQNGLLSNRRSVCNLLSYCLQDLLDLVSSVSKDGQERHACLESLGIELDYVFLVPLADNESIGCLRQASPGISCFLLADARQADLLLPLCPEVMVDCSAVEDDRLLGQLRTLAGLAVVNVRDVDGAAIAWAIRSAFDTCGSSNPMHWAPEEPGHPALDWMQKLWNYLSANEVDLEPFEGLCIVPTKEGGLQPLCKASSILGSERWSDNVALLLSKLGCNILLPGFSIQHPRVSEYIQASSTEGVLHAILSSSRFAGHSDSITRLVADALRDVETETRGEFRRALLHERMIGQEGLSDSSLQLLRILPIFEVHKDLSSLPADEVPPLVALGERESWVLAPLEVQGKVLNSNCLRVSCEKESELISNVLGVPILSMAEFYRTQLIPHLPMLDVDTRNMAVVQMLLRLDALRGSQNRTSAEQASSLWKDLPRMKFVPTGSGQLKAPMQLYDPRSAELQALLHPEEDCPAGSLVAMDPTVLDLLTLRTRLDLDSVVSCAESIHKQANDQEVDDPSVTTTAARRGAALFNFLQGNEGCELIRHSEQSGTNMSQFWRRLENTEWCPVLLEAPVKGLPWAKVNKSVAAPRMIRTERDMWLVSSCMLILGLECTSEVLMKHLGWLDPVSASVAAGQLVQLGAMNQFSPQTGSLAHTLSLDPEASSTSPEAFEEAQCIASHLEEIAGHIYACLANVLDDPRQEIVTTILEGQPCIWVGRGFVTPSAAILSLPEGVSQCFWLPCVNQATCARFGKLFGSLGVRESSDARDYLLALERMDEANHGKALVAPHIVESVALVEALVARNNPDAPLDDVLVPDTEGILAPASSVAYNDAEWLAGSKGFRIVHPSVSALVAEKAGCPSLRYLLSTERESVGALACPPLDVIKAQLLMRGLDFDSLRPDSQLSVHLLMEFLQLGMALGASEVHFALDSRHYKAQSLLQSQLAGFQGPALLIHFTDRTMSPQEVALHHLPCERDENGCLGPSSLIGAYIFTDVLQVLSGESLMFIDPANAGLDPSESSGPEDASVRQRDRKTETRTYKFAGSNITRRFMDQFAPFVALGIDLSQSFPGTLLRLPLRSSHNGSRGFLMEEGNSELHARGAQNALMLLSHMLKRHAAGILACGGHPVRKVSVRSYPATSPGEDPSGLDARIDICRFEATIIKSTPIAADVKALVGAELLSRGPLEVDRDALSTRRASMRSAHNSRTSLETMWHDSMGKKGALSKLPQSALKSLLTSYPRDKVLEEVILHVQEQVHHDDNTSRMDTRVSEEHWLISSALGYGRSADVAASSRLISQRPPIAGVGVCTWSHVLSPTEDTTDPTQSSPTAPRPVLPGHTYSPLPIFVHQLQFPVQIHGNFQPEVNPMSFKYDVPLTSGQTESGACHSNESSGSSATEPLSKSRGHAKGSGTVDSRELKRSWNDSLLACVAEAYQLLLARLQILHLRGRICEDASERLKALSFDSVWPVSGELTSKEVIEPVVRGLASLPIWCKVAARGDGAGAPELPVNRDDQNDTCPPPASGFGLATATGGLLVDESSCRLRGETLEWLATWTALVRVPSTALLSFLSHEPRCKELNPCNLRSVVRKNVRKWMPKSLVARGDGNRPRNNAAGDEGSDLSHLSVQWQLQLVRSVLPEVLDFCCEDILGDDQHPDVPPGSSGLREENLGDSTGASLHDAPAVDGTLSEATLQDAIFHGAAVAQEMASSSMEMLTSFASDAVRNLRELTGEQDSAASATIPHSITSQSQSEQGVGRSPSSYKELIGFPILDAKGRLLLLGQQTVVVASPKVNYLMRFYTELPKEDKAMQTYTHGSLYSTLHRLLKLSPVTAESVLKVKPYSFSCLSEVLDKLPPPLQLEGAEWSAWSEGIAWRPTAEGIEWIHCFWDCAKMIADDFWGADELDRVKHLPLLPTVRGLKEHEDRVDSDSPHDEGASNERNTPSKGQTSSPASADYTVLPYYALVPLSRASVVVSNEGLTAMGLKPLKDFLLRCGCLYIDSRFSDCTLLIEQCVPVLPVDRPIQAIAQQDVQRNSEDIPMFVLPWIIEKLVALAQGSMLSLSPEDASLVLETLACYVRLTKDGPARIAQQRDKNLVVIEPLSPSQLLGIRCLPIWPLAGGQLICLPSGAALGSDSSTDGGTTYVLSTCPPESAEWVHALGWDVPPNDGTLLLFDEALRDLYKQCGIKELVEHEALERFLLPCLDGLRGGSAFGVQLSSPQRACALSYIRQRYPSLKAISSFTRCLGETAFVPADVARDPMIISNTNLDEEVGRLGENPLKKPRELMDPEVELLRAIFKNESMFPSGILAREDWLTILRELGLQRELDCEGVLQAGHVLERRWENVIGATSLPEGSAAMLRASEITSTACSLMKFVEESFASLFSASFCEQLGLLRCWPAKRIALTSRETHVAVLTTAREAALDSDWPLCWSCAPLLDKSFGLPKFAWSALRLRSPPRLEVVLQHLEALGAREAEGALSLQPTGLSKLDCTKTVLRFIDDNWHGLSSSQVAALRSCPLVPVAHESRLAAASQLYTRPTSKNLQLAPVFWEMPHQLDAHTELLKRLGAVDTPQGRDLEAAVLSMRKASRTREMQPNETAALLRIIAYLDESEQMSSRFRSDLEKNEAQTASGSFSFVARRAKRAMSLSRQAQQAWLPVSCGDPVSEEDKKFVQREPNPLRFFSANEIVAWTNHPGDASIASDDFLYGIVAHEAGPAQGQSMYSVPIVSSQDGRVQNVLSCYVHAFQDSARGHGWQDVRASTSDATADDEQLGLQVNKDTRAIVDIDAKTITRTVKSMLLAAGIRPELEQEKMLEQSLELKAELRAMKGLEEKARAAAEQAEQKAEAFAKEWECRICIQNKVEAVLAPCGHALCYQCGTKVAAKCPFCRSGVSSLVRLYLP